MYITVMQNRYVGAAAAASTLAATPFHAVP
jgi:hypothetical protein